MGERRIGPAGGGLTGVSPGLRDSRETPVRPRETLAAKALGSNIFSTGAASRRAQCLRTLRPHIHATYDVAGRRVACRAAAVERLTLYSSTWSPSGGGGTAGHESNTLTIDAAIIFIRLQHLPRQPHRHALAESQGHAFAANQSRMLPPATCSRCGSARKHVAAPGSPRPQRSEQPCSSIALFVIFFTSVTLSRFSTLAFLIRSGIVSRVASQGLSIALVQPAPGHARPQHLSEARPLPSPPNTLIPPRRCRRSRFRRRTRRPRHRCPCHRRRARRA